MLLELKVPPELVGSEYSREIQIDPEHTVRISIKLDGGFCSVGGTLSETSARGRSFTIEKRGRDCETLLAWVARSLSACYSQWQEPPTPRLVWRSIGRA